MTDDERISAYIDGALSPEDTAALEAEAARDPALAAEIEALTRLDGEIEGAFDALLDLPVPAALAAAASAGPRDATPAPANIDRPPRFTWGSVAAALALVAVGAVGGAALTRGLVPPVEVAAARGWMDEIADYHRVYARQTMHLVEVPASQKDNIEAWLGRETGVTFKVPDLAASGFTFQGARLLVAAGKPVAQLLYTDAGGQVLALCALAREGEPTGTFDARQFGDVEMVRWTAPGAAWVAVGTAEMPLEEIARVAAGEV